MPPRPASTSCARSRAASNAADVRAMLDACKEHKVQFMDGVMFMHSPRLPLLRKVLDDGESVGELRRITVATSASRPPASSCRRTSASATPSSRSAASATWAGTTSASRCG